MLWNHQNVCYAASRKMCWQPHTWCCKIKLAPVSEEPLSACWPSFNRTGGTLTAVVLNVFYGTFENTVALAHGRDQKGGNNPGGKQTRTGASSTCNISKIHKDRNNLVQPLCLCYLPIVHCFLLTFSQKTTPVNLAEHNYSMCCIIADLIWVEMYACV